MIKIITWLLTKMESKLSKKEKCYQKNETNNKKLQLYRTLLNEIDKYNSQGKDIAIFRHYRFKTISIERSKED